MAERRERTDAEKAIEAIETQERKIARARAKVQKAKEAVKEAEVDVRPLEGRLAFLLTDPALPKEFLEARAPQKAEAVVRD